MLTTRHPIDFAYTRPELEALFRYARAHDVETGPYLRRMETEAIDAVFQDKHGQHSFTSVASEADSPARSLRLSPATGHTAEILDG